MVFHSDLVGFNGDLMRILLHDTDLMVIEWDFFNQKWGFSWDLPCRIQHFAMENYRS